MKLFEIAQYKTDVDEEKIWDLLNTHCQDALGKLPIVRGMNRFEKGYGVVHGEAGHRESANTTNHYTVILDEVLPENFPKRSKSIICSNWENRSHSKNYGFLYAIVPFDGVSIGICPEGDMFATEIKLSDDANARPIQRWNSFYDDNDIRADSFPELLKDFKAFLSRRDFLDLNPKNIEEKIRTAYTEPFKCTTTADDSYYNDGTRHELWIGGKCVAIDLFLYRKMMRDAKAVK